MKLRIIQFLLDCPVTFLLLDPNVPVSCSQLPQTFFLTQDDERVFIALPTDEKVRNIELNSSKPPRVVNLS
jgi:hypothetical protein